MLSEYEMQILEDSIIADGEKIAALRVRLSEVEAQNRCLLEEVYDLADCMCLEYHECVGALAQNTALAEALREIETLYWHDAPCPQDMRDIAREALAKLEEPR